jgi:hypothetical protein
MQVGISKLGGYKMLAGDCLGVFSKVVLGQNNEWLTAGAASAVAAPWSSVAGPLDPHGRRYTWSLGNKTPCPLFVADAEIMARRRVEDSACLCFISRVLSAGLVAA